MSEKSLLAAALMLSSIFAPLSFAQSQEAPQTAVPAGKKQASRTTASPQHEDEGQRIFDQNCARCHAAPEGFSPSISGTIVRHMRVRAGLSRHDEQELLRFFNP